MISTHNSSLEGATKLKFVPFCSSEVLFPIKSFLAEVISGQKPWTIVHGLIIGTPKKRFGEKDTIKKSYSTGAELRKFQLHGTFQ